MTMTDAAIRLRGFVKRFGAITAVDGLDLDVPYGHVRRPARPQRRGQVDDDEGADRAGHRRRGRARGPRLPASRRLQAGARRDGRRAAARQPRRVADRRAEPRSSSRTSTACRAAQRARARSSARSRSPTSATRRDSKVDELRGGMRRRLLIARALLHRPRLILLDEPTVGLDPQVRQELWALIDRLRSEGVSILMSTHYIEEAERLCDQVTIMSHGKAVAVGSPRELIAEHAGAEAIEVYGPPARLSEVEAAGAATAAGRRGAPDVDLDPALNGDARRRSRRRAPRHQPRGRLRAAHRRGDRLMAAADAAAARLRPPPRRLERAALQGVMVREVVNFSSFWRSSTFSSTVDPTIYLLAFGFGFGSLVSTRRRLLATSTSSAPGSSPRPCCSAALPGDVLDVRQVPVPAHLRRDPRRAGRHRGAGDRRGAVDRRAHRRLRLRADARGDGLRPEPELGDAARARSSPRWPASAGRASASSSPPRSKRSRASRYWQSGLLTPMFLVAGTFFPLSSLPRVGADRWQPQPALPLRRSSSATSSSASGAGPTSGTSPSWSASRSSRGGSRSASWSAS